MTKNEEWERLQKAGGSAFPCVQVDDTRSVGMTLRDWFAGRAMQTLIANNVRPHDSYSTLAKGAYAMADAMLAERRKT